MTDKMTTIIEFKRQLWPQPPKDATPSWYLTNTLGFSKNGKKCPRCGVLLQTPGRVDCWSNSVNTHMPLGSLRAGEGQPLEETKIE